MNSRGGRYPPGNGSGRGVSVGGNPNFYARNPQQQQQYVQRNPVQGQHNQQQQWLRRNQMGSDFGTSEVVKSVQSDSIDSR
ncbi:putative DEAD-box ATP-dependent RNA helicase 6 [Cocos nucifera]|nr:putative DEAD-box ATP-dependent RNA helicase 6 [Cocos nucifera]